MKLILILVTLFLCGCATPQEIGERLRHMPHFGGDQEKYVYKDQYGQKIGSVERVN